MRRDADIGRIWALGLLLACLAVGLRLVVPAGFMPGVGAEGRAALVICTAGPGDAPDTSPTEPGHAQAHEAPCAFAGLGAAPAPESLLSIGSAPATYARAPALALRDLTPGRGLSAPPPPSQGPPLPLA